MPLASNASFFNSSVDDTIKIALIGCGGRGTGAASQALAADPNVKLWAVGDAFRDRTKEVLTALRQNPSLEPKVDVCERRYMFDADSPDRFSPAERCPAYKVPEDIAVAVREKQRRDEIESVELINRGIPTVPVATARDGGMNPTFLAAVRSQRDSGAVIRTASGTIPAHVNPPEGDGDD